MPTTTFLIRLGSLTAGTAAILALLYFVAPPAQTHGVLMVASVLFFVLICTGLFFAGNSAAHSSNKYAFNNLVSVSVFGKMLLSVAFLYVYRQVAQPANEWYVGIFLTVYVVYTVFEVWFMTLLAKTK